jgi:hypothetical protein
MPPLGARARLRSKIHARTEAAAGDAEVTRARQLLADRGISEDDAYAFVRDLDAGSPELERELKAQVEKSDKPLYRDLHQLFRSQHKKETEERKQSMGEPAEEIVDEFADEEESEGEERVRLFEEDLQKMSPPRSRFQHEFHDLAKPALLPHIYGKDQYARSHVRILDKLDTDVLPAMILLYIRRRGGKTDGAARLAAACGNNFPDGKKILLMAQTRNISRALLVLVKKYFRQLPGADARVVKDTADEFWVFPRSVDPDQARLADNWINTAPINRFKTCAGNLSGK